MLYSVILMAMCWCIITTEMTELLNWVSTWFVTTMVGQSYIESEITSGTDVEETSHLSLPTCSSFFVYICYSCSFDPRYAGPVHQYLGRKSYIRYKPCLLIITCCDIGRKWSQSRISFQWQIMLLVLNSYHSLSGDACTWSTFAATYCLRSHTSNIYNDYCLYPHDSQLPRRNRLSVELSLPSTREEHRWEHRSLCPILPVRNR